MELLRGLNPPDNFIRKKDMIDRYITRVLSDELARISTPCYMPNMSKYLEDLKYLTGMDKKFLAEFLDKFPSYYTNFQIFRDQYTLMILYIFLFYVEREDEKRAKLYFQFLTFKFYYNKIHKYFPKFCDEKIWEMALNRVSGKHLFRLKDSISNSILYIADVDFTKFYRKLKVLREKDVDNFISQTVASINNKFNQSVKSFANKYHDLFSNRDMIQRGETSEDQLQQSRKAQSAANIANSMTTYGEIDKQALGESIKMSGIDKKIGIDIVKELSNVQNREKVQFIIVLMDKVRKIDQFCSNRVRSFVVRKIADNVKINKYYIKKEIKEMVDGLNLGSEIKTTNDNQIVMFVAHYLSMFVYTKLCR